MKKWLVNISLLILSVGITLGIIEFGLRQVLFNGNPDWGFLRNPAMYALYHRDGVENHFSDDYWKLNYLFNRPFNVTEPHPLLGWTGFFDKQRYEHADQAFAKGRRHVLLFGDSFAMCVDSVQCFQDLLNADTTFSKDHYLLNYGVGGYGIDQIHLLAQEVVPTHEKPFVIFSMLTTDMDRSMLYMRDSRKGRFKILDGDLTLTGTPITVSTEEYVTENPPEITSYSLNLIINGLVNAVGEPDRLKWKYIEEMRSVNEALVRKTVEQFRASDTEFVILLFQGGYHGPNEWRNIFLRDLFEEMEVPYIASSDVIGVADQLDPKDVSAYTITGDGHPTSYANKLVSEVLRQYLLNPELRDAIDARNNWPKE